MNQYIDILKASGLKATVQRLTILEIMAHLGHITIDKLYQEVNQTHPTLSLATIYKNILMLIDKKVVVEVPVAGSKSYYELKKQDHIHLICEECGIVKDKEIDESLLNLSINQDSFLASHLQVNIYGTCRECQ